MEPGLPLEPDLPEGFRYERNLLDSEEEQELVEAIRRVEFSPFEMRGVVAKRRVAFFGRTYDAGSTRVQAIPDFLLSLRQRAAAWAGMPADRFVMALVNEYTPGAPIGWHRDALHQRGKPRHHVIASKRFGARTQRCSR